MNRDMLARQHETARDLVDQHLKGQFNRRDMLKRAGMLGISVPVLSAALGARGAIAQSTPAASPSGSPSPVAEEAPLQLGSYDGTTLKVAIAMAESEVTVFNEVVVNGFKEATSGDIEVVNIQAVDVVRTLEAQVGGGNIQLDLLVQDNNTLAPLVEGGLVEELPEAEEVMPPATIEALKEVLQFDGKYYFLPARPNVQITYYNSAKFEEYGVQPPMTWDELASTAQTIQENAGVGQVSVQGVTGGPVGVTVTQFLWQAGGDPLMINNEAGQQAFQFMQDLKPNLTPQYPTADFNTTNTYFLNQSVVLAQNWPFGVVVVVGEGGMTDVLTYAGWEGPAGNALVLGGDVFGIATGTPNRAMALDFTKYWMSREVQEQLTARNGWAAMRSDALGQVEDWQQPYFETVTEALTFTKPRPNVTYWIDVENILSNAFNDIVTGGAPVAETLDRYQGEIDTLSGGA
jgi:trehalose transport system substrate-binding protein